MRSLSPRMAPPEKGLEGSTAKTATFLFLLRKYPISLSVRVLLPEPGGPVIPTTWALPMAEAKADMAS